MANENVVDARTLSELIDGKLSWEEVKKILKGEPKDPERFQTYINVLQERVPWKDRILLRIADHLYVVQTADRKRVVRCDCGYDFGDYRQNWKLAAQIYVRTTSQEFRQIYQLDVACPEPGLIEIREFYCPGCSTQLSVECVPPGTPPVFEMLPDLDAFYREWVGEPLPDEDPSWFEDRTQRTTERWRAELETNGGSDRITPPGRS